MIIKIVNRLAVFLLALLSLATLTASQTTEKKKRELRPVPRIEEKVDLREIKGVPAFLDFLNRHGFPVPDFPVFRFTPRETNGLTYLNAFFRFSDVESLERMYKDYKEFLAVNKNVEADQSNRYTGYTVNPQTRDKSGNGTLIFHNPEAGYTLQYTLQGDYSRSQAMVIIVLRTYQNTGD